MGNSAIGLLIKERGFILQVQGGDNLINIAAGTDTILVACTRCDRTGRYPVSTLIARYGPRFAARDLLRVLSVGCPMRESVDPFAVCGLDFVDLSLGRR